MQLSSEQARDRFASARVARLATINPDGRPHLVPIVFAIEHDVLYTAVDAKPKRTTSLQRLTNVAAAPSVAVLADYYDDADWEALWWARADGDARVVQIAEDEGRHAIELLTGRYQQYREHSAPGPVLAVDVRRWSGWAAS
jgi:PPOX class probable F420-dependent enzyme